MLPAFDERFQVLEMLGIPALLVREAFLDRRVSEHLEAMVVEFNECGRVRTRFACGLLIQTPPI